MKIVLISFLLILCLALTCFSQKKNSESLRHELIIPPKPIDPQIIQDQDDMTWADYRPVSGKNWADSSLKPEREFRMALVAVDFPDQPFVITLPKGSDLFGNPQTEPVERADVPKFYADFWLKPSELNHGQTINGYWMEQSRGKFGIKVLDAFGPYRMPKNLWEYGLNEYKQGSSAPFGAKANKRMEPHVDSLWKAHAGDVKKNYDAILRIYAGYDETGVWQEFGEMKFLTRDDIPPAWGNPDTTRPRWIPTRYVPWTSWKAGQMQWGLSSIRQGENSGTITHELGHFAFDIGDNNNNPYVQPYRRVGSGPWDMMDRGSFNGPGGPHMRWVVPAAMGASMPAGLMLRNRMVNGFISESQVLTLGREKLDSAGPVVASITARAVEPQKGSYAGIIVRLDGPEPHDRTPVDDPGQNPLSPGIPNYHFYSIEVVQRMGYDSFCPDNGVLIAKNKDKESRNGGPNEFNCFNWVIDAHPEDINMIDFIRPDGNKVMRTIADYRQLNDALFHAGVNSGSRAEFVDTANGIHFYIINVKKDDDGILNYEIGIRSLDSDNNVKSNFKIHPLRVTKNGETGKYIFFKVKNTGKGQLKDILRLSVESEGSGCSAQLLNNFVTLGPGNNAEIPVFVSFAGNATCKAAVNFKVVSESDPSIRAESFKKIRK
jgi:M6 family metalloprotease-like protein